MSKCQLSIGIRETAENIPVIDAGENDAEDHLQESDDDRELHLQRVGEHERVVRQVPYRVHPERIRVIEVTMRGVQAHCLILAQIRQLVSTMFKSRVAYYSDRIWQNIFFIPFLENSNDIMLY